MKNQDMTNRLQRYIDAQPNKPEAPFNPDNYEWEDKGTRWKQLAIILLSPASCILVWLYLAFLAK